MSSPVVHFEIGSADAAAASSFYTSVFGWSFADVGPAKLIVGGAEGGPSGMLNALGHSPENYVMIYIQVDDVEASLELIAKYGGACMVPPQPLPDGRRFAWIKDPAGNLIGLLTPLP